MIDESQKPSFHEELAARMRRPNSDSVVRQEMIKGFKGTASDVDRERPLHEDPDGVPLRPASGGQIFDNYSFTSNHHLVV